MFSNSGGLVLLSVINTAMLTGCVAAKIVSLPHQRYVLEGNQAIVRCQNRSDDGVTFHSYITTAVWYRDYNNGTITQIGSSGPVYADKHTLILSSISEADQGFYYCCVPAGPCGNGSSEGTSILISTPAVIIAASPSYISTVGSSVTLTCNIVDKGAPQTSFSWRRNGNEINDESRLSINDTAMSLTLTNITMDNGGTYFCTGTGVISHRRDAVELIVEDSPEWRTTVITTSYGEEIILPCTTNITSPTNYRWELVSVQSRIAQGSTNSTLKNGSLLLSNVQQSATFKCTAVSEEETVTQFVELVIRTNNSILESEAIIQLIHLQSTDAGASCYDTELEEYLLVILQSYLYQMCGCNHFKVRVNCSDTGESRTVYSIQLTGPMANKMLQLWLMQKENQESEIELGAATFTICNQTCTKVTKTMSNDNKNFVLISIIVIASVICILILAVTFSLVCCFCCRQMFGKGRCKIDQPENSTNSQTGSMPANYDKLNHTYLRNTQAEPSRQQIAQSHANKFQYLTCINQEVECKRKPTVGAMENGKGFVRSSHGVTAILNPPALNVDVDITPSKTHPSYYDVNIPTNTDNRQQFNF